MLNKEKIEKAKQNFKEEVDNEIKVYSLVNDYTQSKTDNHKIILEYIEQLETEKQKLIEKLEKDIKENNFKETECLEDKGRYYHAQEVLKILKGEDNA